MKIAWDKTGERFYETGVKHGVLYPRDNTGAYPLGVAWNGLTAVTESPSGAEPTPLWADNIKYIVLVSTEEHSFTIEAYTYPDEFGECDGTAEPEDGVKVGQQSRKPFGFAYVTQKGNDTEGQDAGFLLHLNYNALAAPSEKAYATINDSPEAITFSWECSTTPVEVTGTGLKPTATITIDSTKVDPDGLEALLEELYGTDDDPTAEPPVVGKTPRLPLPAEVLDILAGP